MQRWLMVEDIRHISYFGVLVDRLLHTGDGAEEDVGVFVWPGSLFWKRGQKMLRWVVGGVVCLLGREYCILMSHKNMVVTVRVVCMQECLKGGVHEEDAGVHISLGRRQISTGVAQSTSRCATLECLVYYKVYCCRRSRQANVLNTN